MALPAGPVRPSPPVLAGRREGPLSQRVAAAQKAHHLRSDDPWGPLLRASFLSRAEAFKLSPKTVSTITQLVSCFLISHVKLQQEAGQEKKSWGGGGKRVLFLSLAPAPSQRQRAVLDEIRHLGQGPSPGPRSHRAQAKVCPRPVNSDLSHPNLADLQMERETSWGHRSGMIWEVGGPPGTCQCFRAPSARFRRGKVG